MNLRSYQMLIGKLLSRKYHYKYTLLLYPTTVVGKLISHRAKFLKLNNAAPHDQ